MARLELRFFGAPRCRFGDEPVRLDRRKAEALLAYLVLEPGEHRRSELALLLWPELAPAKGRAALRRTLIAITAAFGTDSLVITRQSLAIRRDATLWCDVTAFEDALACGELERAANLYEDDFLSGLTLADAVGFDAWQRAQSERLRTRLAAALHELVQRYRRDGDDERALACAERWTKLDPLDERPHELAMEILVASGQRGRALRLFDAFAARLERELDIEPPSSMLELRRARPTIASTKSLDATHATWRDACEQHRVDVIDASLDRIYSVCDRRGLYRDGIALLDGAFYAVHEGALLGRLLSRQAVLYACMGQLAKARALLEASLRFATSQTEIAFCENRLGGVVFAEGEYASGRRYLRSSAKRYRHAGDGAGLAWTLNVLGHLSVGTASAPKLLSESLARSRREDDEPRIASTLNSIGKDAYVRRDLARARRSLSSSLERRRALGHRIGVADSLNNLGNVLVAVNEVDEAERAFDEAFDIAEGIRARPLVAEILIGLSSLRHVRGELETAARLAAAALYLPGGWRDAKDRAQASLTTLSATLPRAAMERATLAGREYRVL